MDSAIADEARSRRKPRGSSSNTDENNYFFGKNHTKRQLCGAAVVGGAVGLAAMGSAVVGLAAAGGAVYAATRRDKVGVVMRSTGDTVADVGISLKKFDKTHRISEKATDSIIKGNQWISKQLKSQEEIQGQRRPNLDSQK
ncbi:MAG: hypothetical protein SGILL_007368 [Bacillariaceae sp.]